MRNEVKAVLMRLEEINAKVKSFQIAADNRGDFEAAEGLEEEIGHLIEAIEALLEIE